MTVMVGLYEDDWNQSDSSNFPLFNDTTTERIFTHDKGFSHSPSLDWIDFVELTCLFAFVLIGTPANALTFVVQCWIPDKVSTDILIAGLALVDFFNSTVMTPFNLVLSGYKMAIFSTPFCRSMSFSAHLTALSSAAFIGALALDRYMLSCRPFNQWYSKQVAKRVCVIIPLSVGVLACPILFMLNKVEGKLTCTFPEHLQIVNTVISNIILLLIASDFIIIIVCYSNIALLIRKQNKARVKRMGSRIDRDRLSTGTWFGSTGNQCQTSTTDTEDVVLHKATQDNKHTTVNENANDDEPVELSGNRDTVSCVKQEGANDDKDKNSSINANSVTKPTNMTNTVQTTHVTTKHFKQKDQANRTTGFLFLISLIFMISWSLGVIFVIYGQVLSRVLQQLLHLGIRVNVVTNPLLLMLMSSKFRRNLKQQVCGTIKCKRCC